MNLPEKLAREIRRVTELRGEYEEIDKLPNVIAGPAIMLMDAALEQACKAAGVDDPLVQMAALSDLQGFEA